MDKTDLSHRVKQYVALRDHIKELDKEHADRMKPYRETLDQLNSLLLASLDQIGQGVDSIRTDEGTVYRTEKKSASLADPAAFMKYVIEQQAWDLLDRKANVTAVADFIEEHNTQPPGVNFQRTFVAGVRRPN
jgi:hypothetical protein